MPTILTKGQQKLFKILLWLALFVLANSTYLFLADPGADLSVFYQLMLIGHLVGGLALLLVMTVFFIWHLKRVKRLMHLGAVVSGVTLTLAAYLLFATGIFIIYESNARDHLWVFYSHRVLAIVAVLQLVQRQRLRGQRAQPIDRAGGIVHDPALLTGRLERLKQLGILELGGLGQLLLGAHMLLLEV